MMDWFAINPNLMHYLAATVTSFGSGEMAAFPLAAVIFRPVQAEDVDLILEMHQRLSADTIFNRYFSPRVPTRPEIVQICQGAAGNNCVVAAVTGKRPEIIGMAYYVLSGQNTAETAVLVEDRYQGQGVGRQLLNRLTDLAIDQGIQFFDAYVLPSNKPMIHLLHNTGQLVHNKLDFGAREMRIQL